MSRLLLHLLLMTSGAGLTLKLLLGGRAGMMEQLRRVHGGHMAI